jgi:hypothetical protein
MDLTKLRSLVKVIAVCNDHAIAHFPITAATDKRIAKKCKCGQKEHGKLLPSCDFRTLGCFGAPPFAMVETCHRMRLCPDQQLSAHDEDEDQQDNVVAVAPNQTAQEMEDVASEDEEQDDAVLEDNFDQESVHDANVDVRDVDLHLAQDQIDEMNIVVDRLLNKSPDVDDGDDSDAGHVAATLPEMADDDNDNDDGTDESANATAPEQEAAARKLEAAVKALIDAVTKEAEAMADPSKLEQKAWN